MQVLIQHTSGLLFNAIPQDSGPFFSLPHNPGGERNRGMWLIGAPTGGTSSLTLWRVDSDYISLTFNPRSKDFKIVRQCTEGIPSGWIVEQNGAIDAVKKERGEARGCAKSSGW